MEKGQSFTEFALVLPVLLIILVGILDLGRIVYLNTMLSSAAQAGARAGLVTTSTAAVEAAVQDKLAGVAPNEVAIAVERTTEYAEVTLTYTFTPVTPLIANLLPDGGVTLQRSARMQTIGIVVP